MTPHSHSATSQSQTQSHATETKTDTITKGYLPIHTALAHSTHGESRFVNKKVLMRVQDTLYCTSTPDHEWNTVGTPSPAYRDASVHGGALAVGPRIVHRSSLHPCKLADVCQTGVWK